jgi:hypothetical protein
MWAICLHGYWTIGTEWDGMRRSILGEILFPFLETTSLFCLSNPITQMAW